MQEMCSKMELEKKEAIISKLKTEELLKNYNV